MLTPLSQDLTSALLDGSLRAALPIALLFTVYAVYPVYPVYPVWCALALRKLMRYAAGASAAAAALVPLTSLSAFAKPSKGSPRHIANVACSTHLPALSPPDRLCRLAHAANAGPTYVFRRSIHDTRSAAAQEVHGSVTTLQPHAQAVWYRTGRGCELLSFAGDER
ncbi:MAG TPA: hypothetical protein VF040_06740 [Ktedonobacterales bacterium]